MKKSWLSIIGLAFIMFSCKTTEEIWIDKDQSVRQHISLDLSALVPFLQMGLEQQGLDLDLPGIPKFNDAMPKGQEDAPKSSPEDVLKKLISVAKLDTTIYLKSFLTQTMQKQGLTEPQFIDKAVQEVKSEDRKNAAALMKTLLKAKIHVQIDADEGVYQATLMQDYAPKEFAGAAQFMTSIPELMGGAKPDALGKGVDELDKILPTYALTKKQFSIMKQSMDADKLGGDMGQDNPLDMIGSLGGMMDYEYIIHVPQRIKSVNLSHTKIDDKTIKVKAPSPLGDKTSEPFKLVIKYK